MFTVLRCTVQKSQSTIYCTGLPFTCLFTANDLVSLGLSVYIYIKSKLQQFIPHKLESASESFKPPRTRLWWSSSPSSHPDGEHGTFPQTHCKRDSNFGYSFLFLFWIFAFLYKKSKGQHTLFRVTVSISISILVLLHTRDQSINQLPWFILPWERSKVRQWNLRWFCINKKVSFAVKFSPVTHSRTH